MWQVPAESKGARICAAGMPRQGQVVQKERRLTMRGADRAYQRALYRRFLGLLVYLLSSVVCTSGAAAHASR
jgi:hypothetical protein